MQQGEQIIEVRYAGIVVGQATATRDHTPSGVFVGVLDPMPVGTILSLKVGDQITDGRVEHVTESADAASAGMRIRFVDNRAAMPKPQAAAPAASTPAPAAPAPVAVAASPTPVAAAPAAPVPVDDSPSQASSGVPSDEGGEGDSERIPAPPGLAGGSGPNAFGGGGGRRRRRRR